MWRDKLGVTEMFVSFFDLYAIEKAVDNYRDFLESILGYYEETVIMKDLTELQLSSKDNSEDAEEKPPQFSLSSLSCDIVKLEDCSLEAQDDSDSRLNHFKDTDSHLEQPTCPNSSFDQLQHPNYGLDQLEDTTSHLNLLEDPNYSFTSSASPQLFKTDAHPPSFPMSAELRRIGLQSSFSFLPPARPSCSNRSFSKSPPQPLQSARPSFPCPECNKTFSTRFRLRVHLRLHTGETPYVCTFCGKGFVDRGNFSVHQRVHTRERPYRCADCGRQFSTKGNLSRHQQTQHALALNL